MADEARQEEIQAAQEVVHAAVVEARRVAAERGFDLAMILGIAATRLEAFALWAALTQTKPEDLFKKEVRIVGPGQSANPS
jgi:hypothetical protein